MGEITLSDQLDGLPGYLQARRLAEGTPGASMFKPAWNKLELFPAKTAEEFLAPKLAKLLKCPDEDMDTAIEIVLGFGIMSVFADRENTEYVQGIERQVAERAAAATQAEEIEREAEERATRDTSIDW